jgi:hypothetical protein
MQSGGNENKLENVINVWISEWNPIFSTGKSLIKI